MVGGRIVSVKRSGDNRATILVRGTGCEHRDLRRVETAYRGEIPTGGSIWWQRERMFIAAPGAKKETEIVRIGHAY